MSFLPQSNPALEEVQSENLIKNKEYLIEFTSYDNENVRERGIFVGKEGDGSYALSKFKLPSMGNMTVPFQNSRTRFYRPRTQEILDNSAQRQYVASETARLINENTGTELGTEIVEDFNKRPPSGGKRVKKHKTRHGKRKQTRYRKRKYSRRK
jgi:hypothetical protein